MPVAQTFTGVVVYEGARLITGDASAPIEDSAFVVEGGRFTQVGRRGAEDVPPDGLRVNYHFVIEIEGGKRPACVAELIALHYR
jgi:hypothetical protein